MTGKTLSEQDIKQRLTSMPGWKYEDKAINRQLVFKDFREAISFLVLIAFDAEEADHHPDISLSYKKMGVSLSTHSEGGVTEKDLALAQKIGTAFDRK